MAPSETLYIHVAWFCDTGTSRNFNDDALLVQKGTKVFISIAQNGSCVLEMSGEPVLLAVADGYSLGEDYIARSVLDDIGNEVSAKKAPIRADDLVTIVEGANRLQHEERIRRPDRPALGASLTAALLDSSQAIIAQVGDTRCYQYRDAKLGQVTTDQTLAEQMIREGRMSAEEARNWAFRYVVLQAIGPTVDLEVGISTVGLRDKDWIMLCSNGIWEFVADSQIETTLKQADCAATAVRKLVSLALEKGGHDNIAVIAARVSNSQEAL
jgi:protein phosphatase